MLPYRCYLHYYLKTIFCQVIDVESCTIKEYFKLNSHKKTSILLTFFNIYCIVATTYMKKLSILYYFCTLVLFAIIMNPVQVLAAGNCLTLNNGGPTSQQLCVSPLPTPDISTTPLIINNNQQQNHAGQTVYPPTKTKSTPDTGPEDWSLPLLLLLAGMGVLLQNKSKHFNLSLKII